MVSEKRDKKAVKRFFKKAIGQHGLPEKITMDKSGANKSIKGTQAPISYVLTRARRKSRLHRTCHVEEQTLVCEIQLRQVVGEIGEVVTQAHLQMVAKVP